jgi:hypothetical protein
LRLNQDYHTIIKEINSDAKELIENIFNPKFFYKEKFSPLIGVFGLHGTGIKVMQDTAW